MKPDSSLNSWDTALLIPWMFMGQILPCNPCLDPHQLLAVLLHESLSPEIWETLMICLSQKLLWVPQPHLFPLPDHLPHSRTRPRFLFPVFWSCGRSSSCCPWDYLKILKYIFDLRKYLISLDTSSSFCISPETWVTFPDHGNVRIWMSSINCSIN